MNTKPLLILKTGSTFPSLAAELGDFEDWILLRAGLARTEVEISPSQRDAPPADTTRYCGAVITGSHAMVTDREPWSETLAGWVLRAMAGGLPILGICYGHQLLAHALGGEVTYQPKGIEIGTVNAHPTAAAGRDPLFSGISDRFPAQAVHRQTVTRLPPGATLLAGNAFEPHHAFRHGSCAWGLQFHPEYDEAVMRGYLHEMKDTLEKEGLDPARIARKVQPTPAASSVLSRFVAYCRDRN
jgi:GMP synthase (glutamine-hydrolysing)